MYIAAARGVVEEEDAIVGCETPPRSMCLYIYIYREREREREKERERDREIVS